MQNRRVEKIGKRTQYRKGEEKDSNLRQAGWVCSLVVEELRNRRCSCGWCWSSMWVVVLLLVLPIMLASDGKMGKLDKRRR